MSAKLQGNFLNNNVVSLTYSVGKEQFDKFVAIHKEASWDNKILAASSFLKLPVSDCLLDPNITLIDNTHAFKIGHAKLGDFITKSESENGLNINWEQWTYNVKAVLYKIKFGIDSESAKDVFLQIHDTTNTLGRTPVSIIEFNYAKDRLIRAQFEQNNREHELTIGEMSAKIKTLISQLNQEQQEKLDAINKLDSALKQINYLQAELSGFKDQSSDVTQYIEAKIYDELLTEIEGMKLDNDKAIQVYLDKINSLEMTSQDQKTQIAQLTAKLEERSQTIGNNSNQSNTLELIKVIQLNDEIKSLKLKVIDLLKSNIHKEKLLGKYATINETRRKITDLLKARNEELARAQLKPTKKENNKLVTAIKSILNSIQN